MKTPLLCACALFAAVLLPVRAGGPWGDSDHQVFLRIETDPPGAIIRSVNADGTNGTEAGRSPTVIPIDLSWDGGFFGKKWHKLTVHTAGGIASSEYDAAGKTHDLSVTFAVEKEGYLTEVVNELVTVLKRSGEEWEDVMYNLPTQRKLIVHLKPVPTDLPAATGTNALRTVIVAAGDKDDLGTILVQDPEGRAIAVDGLAAGRAPLRILTHAGKHTLTATPPKGTASHHEVTVESGKTATLDLPPPTPKP